MTAEEETAIEDVLAYAGVLFQESRRLCTSPGLSPRLVVAAQGPALPKGFPLLDTLRVVGRGGDKKVKARVCRKVDGLDTHLYERALEVRRAFLADPAYYPDPSRESPVEAGYAGAGPPPPTPEKVKVHFKPIANAPILRKSKFLVLSAWTCAELRTSLRNQLQLSDTTPLFIYCNSAFEPSPDQSLADLFKVCFAAAKALNFQGKDVQTFRRSGEACGMFHT